jgi:hypothetical protein
LYETCPEEFFCESMCGIAVKEVPEAFPHGFLYEALVVPAGAMYGENIQGCPDVGMPWMR